MKNPFFIEPRKKKRPDLLSLLCILTFIGSGLQSISNLFMLFNKDFILENIDLNTFDIENIRPVLEMPSSFFLLNTMFFSIALTGAILMWKLRKVGFHIYTLAKISLLFVIIIYNPLDNSSWLDILFTAVFVLLYSKHLKFMTNE